VKPLLILMMLVCASALLLGPLPGWKKPARDGGGAQRMFCTEPEPHPETLLPQRAPEHPALPADRRPVLPRWRKEASESAAGTEMVRLVRELSALLSAGRAGSQLGADAIRARAGPRPPATGISAAVGDVRGFILLQLQGAHRAAEMGLSPSTAIRKRCAAARFPAARRSELRVWSGLAACLDVAETCGAPLADVLLHYAVQLEANLDAAAMRDTALAGPRVTVRLLTWLPVLGLGLGMLMGVDPLFILLEGPVGWAALLSGTALMIAAHYWSRGLLAAASAEH